MNLTYRRCHYGWEHWHMNTPEETPVEEAEPDAYELPLYGIPNHTVDPDPVMNDDADDDLSDVPEGTDDGDTDLDGDDDV